MRKKCAFRHFEWVLFYFTRYFENRQVLLRIYANFAQNYPNLSHFARIFCARGYPCVCGFNPILRDVYATKNGAAFCRAGISWIAYGKKTGASSRFLHERAKIGITPIR